MADTAWMTWAICHEVDPEAFFPEKGCSPRAAKALCQGCPVIGECLEYALEHDLQGVWGGATEEERRRMKRRRSSPDGLELAACRGPSRNDPEHRGTDPNRREHARTRGRVRRTLNPTPR